MALGAFGYRDLATYWPAPTDTGYGGVTFGMPKLLQTKWEDTLEVFTDQSGEENQSRSIVYVLERLEEGGYLALGDLLTTNDPINHRDAYFIKRVDITRDLRGLHEEVRCYL